MRISDWSSDVCSSDLAGFRRVRTPDWLRPAIGGLLLGLLAMEFPYVLGSGHGGIEQVLHQNLPLVVLFTLMAAKCLASAISIGSGFTGGLFSARSEEHTSELQSLMRISYAVFCLKKKTKTSQTTETTK